MLGNGPVYSIKVAKSKMPVREQVKNIMHASYSLIAHILDSKVKPEHIRSVSLKTYNSPSLPFYNFLSKE
jgi:ribosomal protein L1